VSLNGCKRVALVDAYIKGNRKDVPVVGAYSAAIFNVRFAKVLQQFNILTGEEIEGAYAALKYTVDKIFNDIIFGVRYGRKIIKGEINLDPKKCNLIGQLGDPSTVIFFNKDGVIDGPAYGVLFSGKGAAVGPFNESNDEEEKTASEFEMIHCCVEKLTNSIVEVPALADESNEGNQIGVSNEIIQYLSCFGNFGVRNSDGTYQGTVLSELQFRLQALKDSLDESFHKYFGSLNIDSDLVAWALEGTDRLVYVPHQNKVVLKEAKKEFYIRYQGDAMHHVIKGILAVRVEGAKNILIEDVTIGEIENKARLSYPNAGYSGAKDGGHEEQESMVGCFAGNARGLHFANVENVTVHKVTVTDVCSDYGSVYGVCLQNRCKSMVVQHVTVDGLHAGRSMKYATHLLPNKPQKIHGFVIDSSCEKLHDASHIKVGDTLTQPKPHKIEKISIGVVEETHHHDHY